MGLCKYSEFGVTFKQTVDGVRFNSFDMQPPKVWIGRIIFLGQIHLYDAVPKPRKVLCCKVEFIARWIRKEVPPKHIPGHVPIRFLRNVREHSLDRVT